MRSKGGSATAPGNPARHPVQDRIDTVARQLGARIREARKSKRITLETLSRQTALSAGFLSRLERGETSASISNLIVISGQLDIPLRDFFEDDDGPAAPAYVLSRAKERIRSTPLAANGYSYRLSSGTLPDQQMSAFELSYPPGETMAERPVAHEGEEVLYLLEGSIEFRIGEDTLTMRAGDCVHFNPGQPHVGRNVGRSTARLLMVVTPVHGVKHN